MTLKKIVDCRLDKRDPKDYSGHGTHVIGIIGGKITGIAPESEIYSIKVLGEKPSKTDLENIMLGIKKSMDLEVDIINLSLTCKTSFSSFKLICKKAFRQKVFIVASTGYSSTKEFPSGYSFTIGVSGLTLNGNVFGYAKYNILAPAEKIVSTDIKGLFYNGNLRSGTSMAAAHVTGDSFTFVFKL